MTKILVVDDDPHIRELVSLNLERAGFAVEEATDGVAALALLESTRFDMAVVDVMMPHMDGWALCREIRAFSPLPILVLTAKAETVDKIKGFDLGADDYLVKPFDPPELVARIKAVLRRYRIATEQTVDVGGLTLNCETHEVSVGGKEITLPLKEFELLFKLSSFAGKTLTREQLIEDIWGYDYEGDERTVDVHIKRLRERFPEDDYAFRIRTVRGLGYRLEVNV
ncbi:response regulator transcription factor [Alicyclobacillus fastidiosus]|uniref:Heme response regulator HssR n=1 Tax=Alicyclobacillus fastidiosus TaxID=392011 RepID=A0ABV5AD97_9BACL|nr:response regulator transcription factor [Alicyclobacillus fastidiosus]WEH10414.1 response regulator transcription factor [Alicyclobacillus fastidiosus]